MLIYLWRKGSLTQQPHVLVVQLYLYILEKFIIITYENIYYIAKMQKYICNIVKENMFCQSWKGNFFYEKLFCRVLFLPNWLLIKSLQKYSSSKSGWNVIWPQALFPTSKNMKMLVCQKWGDVINQRFRGLIFHVN